MGYKKQRAHLGRINTLYFKDIIVTSTIAFIFTLAVIINEQE